MVGVRDKTEFIAERGKFRSVQWLIRLISFLDVGDRSSEDRD